MATLVFTALGSAVGGPLGGAIGSLIGNHIDRALIGTPRREGPRLRELGVTTSSYGSPIARHFGTMRAPGTIIWATDLAETSERSGGKGRPQTTTYSYAASFAVALSSRPIRRLGRIWADGNLLRGAAGDLKAGGSLRLYLGHGDQPRDPLIASAQGAACPAFRGLAYCVFEALQLAEFGNRIPALTFEIVGDEGEVSLAALLRPLPAPAEIAAAFPGLAGFSDEGGPLAATLATIAEAYPLACDAGGDRLTVRSATASPATVQPLAEAVVDTDDEGAGGTAGWARQRQPDAHEAVGALRYYDSGRDYQAGLQRAEGCARPGRTRTIEFPGALDAASARTIANAAAERAAAARETMVWRTAEIDPATGPGRVVSAPGHAGLWRVEAWEWRESGVELELVRLRGMEARQSAADAGLALTAPDLAATPTQVVAYELPWDGQGAGEARQVFAAVSSASTGWTGAALYLEHEGALSPLGSSGRRRSCIGHAAQPLGPSQGLLIEPGAMLEVQLAAPDFILHDATMAALAEGANRALLGDEVLQFAGAAHLGSERWLLRGLLRGRGGSERTAQAGHPAGAPFVLLDDRPVAIGSAALPGARGPRIVAIGLADEEPQGAEIAQEGTTLRPLTPVHPRAVPGPDGTLRLRWTRRARGAWTWADWVEVPINEQAEVYRVGLGPADAPLLHWNLPQPALDLPAVTLAQLSAQHPGAPLWVRQVGSFAQSEPLLLIALP